jgi:hypothetical protein
LLHAFVLLRRRDAGGTTLIATGSLQHAPLAADWAFVVQLRQGTSFTGDHLCGRAEHVTSGKACLFTSLEDMRAFMEGVMATRPAHPP